MHTSTDLATRKTVEELVREWNFAMHELKTGLEHIQRAQEHLKAFDSSGSGWDLHPFRHDDTTLEFDRKRKRMKAAAWRYLVNRIELKKMASIARAKEIDKQLHERPDTLPDITMENIFGWLETMALKGTEFLNEAVIEVYGKLRPSYMKRHKTNSAFRVGKKVILTGRVSGAYKAGHFRVAYYFEDELRALDNVFHMLDGKALSAYRKGDLTTSIEDASEGVGETDYFRFKCFRNGNLHLQFLRLDLVERLNAIGGSGLPDPDRD
jgi:hypothetical protein